MAVVCKRFVARHVGFVKVRISIYTLKFYDIRLTFYFSLRSSDRPVSLLAQANYYGGNNCQVFDVWSSLEELSSAEHLVGLLPMVIDLSIYFTLFLPHMSHSK